MFSSDGTLISASAAPHALYKMFKTSNIREPYLLINCNRFIKCALTKFRCGVSDIAVHRNRYKNVNIVDMNCPLCKSAKEDEVHFVPAVLPLMTFGNNL